MIYCTLSILYLHENLFFHLTPFFFAGLISLGELLLSCFDLAYKISQTGSWWYLIRSKQAFHTPP